MVETQREVSAYALPLPSVVYRKFPTFPQATALQHCFKSSCRASSAGGARGARALPMRRLRGIASLMTVSLCFRLFLSHFSSAVGDRLRIV